MRASVLFTAAFAAAVMANPVDKRDEVIVTATDIDYVTDIVTVTAGQAAPTPEAPVAPAAAPTPAAPAPQGYGGRRHRHSKKPRPTSSAAPAPAPYSPAPVPAPAPSSAAPAPAPVPTTSAAPAPAPAPSTYAPAPAPAPSSSAAPAPAPSAPSSGNTAPAPDQGSTAPADSYQLGLDHHNAHRANYSASPLTWNTGLADSAMVLAKRCVFKHDGTIVEGGAPSSYGQNIAASSNMRDLGDITSNQWVNNEIGPYLAAGGGDGKQPNTAMSVFEGYGHFTQVVWKDTQEVGCATYDCGHSIPDENGNDTGSSVFTVCNYSPPGNFNNDYAAQIGACKGEPTLS